MKLLPKLPPIYIVVVSLSLFLYYFRASALFVGIYEPTKRKLLDVFPENLSAVAHLVSPHTHFTVGLADCLKHGTMSLLYFVILTPTKACRLPS
jgi:hypothetical protein